jgi:hypothetical protein
MEGVDANAKYVRRDKAILQCVHPDHANDETVDARHNQTGPHLFSEQDRCNHGEKTRQIIQPEHRHSGPPISSLLPTISRSNLYAKGAMLQREQ